MGGVLLEKSLAFIQRQRFSMIFTAVVCLWLVLGPPAGDAGPQGPQNPTGSAAVPAPGQPTAEVVIPQPEPRSFQVALDQIELDWSAAARGTRGERTPMAVAGTTITAHDERRTVVRVEGAGTVAALRQKLAATIAANPEARGELVVYESDRPRTDASRQLLTSDVALLLEDGVALEDIVARVAGLEATAVRGTPRGYVVRCADPLSAVDVARALGAVNGVKRAYPLLKRARVAR
jgi:hypothetical protein